MDAKEQNIRTWSMLCHIAALGGLIFSPLIVLGPVIIWQVKKNELPEINHHGKDAVNFQLTIFIANIAIGFILAILWGGIFGFGMLWRNPVYMLSGWGFGFGFGIASLFILALALLNLAAYILAVVAGIKANNGQTYKYPFSFKFIK